MNPPATFAQIGPPMPILLAVVGVILVTFINIAIWASRYAKVGPNQALIISGRRRQLDDGTWVGFRIIKGGGTFVMPVIEKADTLSLEVLTIKLRVAGVRTAEAGQVEVECTAQVRIKDDEASIINAATHFLSKDAEAIKAVVGELLENHLRASLSGLSLEPINQDLKACAAKVQTAASGDLAKMGLALITFAIRSVSR